MIHSSRLPLRDGRGRTGGTSTILFLAAIFPPLLAASPTTAADARVAYGETLARDACSACHRVTPRQKPPPPVYNPDEETRVTAPSFMAIARDRRMNASFLRQVITRPHYPMREQVFDAADLDAIVAYIQSLRPSSSRQK